ncbi:MAG: Nif3-like dinuclear metal center hexameric protein [Bacteroidota bacterium]
MTVNEVTHFLEELAPIQYAEDFDNVGLLVGDRNQEVTGILVTLDTLENVVDEAIAKKMNLIVSFHPIIFKGLKKLTGDTYVERVVMKALTNNISIYSIHTALDNSFHGVNAKICEVLGIQNPKILIPKPRTIKKLVSYVPKANAEQLMKAIFKAGGGAIGNYTNCGFSVDGTGSFKPEKKANPTIGAIGKIHYQEEVQLNITYAVEKENRILAALFKNHPYEEVAYEVYSLDNNNQHIGMGMVGELETVMEEHQFLSWVKNRMNAKTIRHSHLLHKSVKKIAVLGGSGAFAIKAAQKAKADVFITADIKYHQFYEAEGTLLLVDIGHFETEQFTKNLLVDFLTKKIPNFAIALSESITNPIKYF